MIVNSFLKLFVGAIILSVVVSASALTPVEMHGKLTTGSGYLLDQNKKIVQLRGMSFYWATPGWGGSPDQYTKYYNAATLDALVDNWKCTVVRLAYDPSNPGAWDGCKVVLDEAIKKGIYVIIDWHSHTAETQQSAAVSFFTEKANTYKNVPNVIFEPYNEPKLAGGATTGSQADAQKTWGAIKPYLKAVTKAIRGAGADNLVILGTPYFAQYVNVAASDQVKDDDGSTFKNVAYSFHFYAASHGPNAYYVLNSNPPSGGLESSFLGAAKGKITIFITEWGTTHSDGGEGGKNTYVDETNTDWWFKTYVNESFHFSWCNWSVSDFQTSSIFGSSNTGAIVKRLLTSPTTDTYGTPRDTGYAGTAPTQTVAMPGTQPTAMYNRYYGLVQTANVPYAERDGADVRTAKNTCLSVAPGVTDDYVTYNIKSTTATKNIIVRYLAPAGTGTIDIYLDSSKIGTIGIKTSSKWTSMIAPAPVPVTSKAFSKLQFVFTNATNSGYKIEWFELTNATEITSVLSPQHTIYTAGAKLSMIKKGFTVDFPVSHGYSSYSLSGIDGRIAKSGELTSSMSQLTFNDLSSGTWLLKLEGIVGIKYLKVVVNGR